MAQHRSPLEGLSIVVKQAPHPQAIRLRKGVGPLRSMAWLERLVYDPGTRTWTVIESVVRPDLVHAEEFKMPLLGDESNAEIEEHIALATARDTDAWFRNKVRPNWDRIQQLLYDNYEQRANRAKGRVQFAVPGGNT